jgi:4-methyl-5(b-hydroxyethyl)-thiazole monophosphate biosynthesis
MIYVFLASGFEEIEALTVVDFLRRAKLDVNTIGIGGKEIIGSHNIPVICDAEERDIKLNENLQAIVLPGGMPGTVNLEKSESIQRCIDFCFENNILICAICAAPSILGHKGILKNKNACCFPGFEKDLLGASVKSDFVCTDGNIITAKGMGSAISFSCAIVSHLLNGNKAEAIKESLQCPF